jgi:hypothetical protein
MKNTLAENMLRFGVKNLSESDVKKISEASLTEAPKPYAPFADQTATGLTFKDQATFDSATKLVYAFTSYKYDAANLLPPNIAWGKAFLAYDGSTTPKLKDNNEIQAMLARLAQGMFYVSVFLGRKDCNWAATPGGARLKAEAAYKVFRPKAPSSAAILPGAADLQAIELAVGKTHDVPFAAPDKGQGLGLPAGQYGDSRWRAIFNTIKPQVDAALAYANAPAATPAKPTTTAPAAPGKAAPSTTGTAPR